METIVKNASEKSVNPYANAIRPGVRTYAKMAGGMLRYAAAIEHMFEEEMATRATMWGKDYKRLTTFANDFAIAECFGDDAILDTYKRALRGWIGDYKYMTELIMVLNWLCWFWHDCDEKDLVLSKLYAELYYHAVDAFNEFYAEKDDDTDEARAKKQEACRYYFDCTD